AISSTFSWRSASRHGSGGRRSVPAPLAGEAVSERRDLTREESAARVEPGALLAAEVAHAAGIPAAYRARLHDGRLAHRVFDELVADGGRQGPCGRTQLAQGRKEEHDRDNGEDEERQQPHDAQRSGLIDTARRNSLSWVVSSDETGTPFLLPAKKIPV